MSFVGSIALLAAVLALAACNLPPPSASRTAAGGYQEPETGSLLGGGNGDTRDTPTLDPGLNSVNGASHGGGK